jgi:hypothetical protein
MLGCANAGLPERIQVILLPHAGAAIDLFLHARTESDPVLLRGPVLVTGGAVVPRLRAVAGSHCAAGAGSHCAAGRGRVVGHASTATKVGVNYSSAADPVCPVVAISIRRHATRAGDVLPDRRQPSQCLTTDPSS